MILVNLTCGRNPWKRASVEDSTFRAYLKNPAFLKSILPLSPELDSILRRVFEVNPAKRITIPELRDLIIRCSRFNTWNAPAPVATPPFTAVDYVKEDCFAQTYPDFVQPIPHRPNALVPHLPLMPPDTTLANQFSQLSTSSGSSGSDSGSVFSASSSVSSSSSSSSYGQSPSESIPKSVSPVVQPQYVSPPPSNTWFNPFFSQLAKHVSIQPSMMGPVRVC